MRASVRSVSQWRKAGRQGGDGALAPKPVPGRPRQLTDAPRHHGLNLLLQGARAHGFPTALWTLKRIAAVMQVQFGVHDHPAHVWKLLRGLGWSCQVPKRRPIQRDAQVMAHWQRYQWPARKKRSATGNSPRLPR